MNAEQLKGSWHQLKGEVKKKWARLTDEDLQYIDGEAERLFGKLQERHGLARQQAEKQLAELQDVARERAVGE